MPDPSNDAARPSSIDTDSPAYTVDCLIAQAERHFTEGDLASALPCLREAMALRSQAGDEGGHAHLAQTVGFLCFGMRDHEGAVAAYETALAYRSKVGDQRAQAVTLGRLAEVHQHQGNHHAAIQLLLASLALFCGDAGRKDIGTTLNNLGLSYCETSQRAEARSCFHKSLLIRREVNDLDGLAATLLNLSLLHAEDGDFAQALEALSEANEIHEIAGDKLGLCRTTLRLGMLHLDMADRGTARRHFDAALGLATDAKVASKDDQAAALYNLGDLALQEGDFSDAQPLFEQAEALLVKSGMNVGLGMVRYCLGRLHALTGQPYVALAYFAEAIAIQESSGDLARLSGTLVAIGVLLSSMEKQDAAIAHFEKAQAIQHALHLHGPCAQTGKWLMHANAQLHRSAAAAEPSTVAADPARQAAINMPRDGAGFVQNRQYNAFGMPCSDDFEFPASAHLSRPDAALH